MMMRRGLVLTAILGLASVVTLPPVAAQTGASGVTGAAEAIFASGATFNGVSLSGLTLGQGVLFGENGSATGQFEAVLSGISFFGQARDIIVEGNVTAGSVSGNGTVSIRGTATVKSGDGTLPVSGVPFTATVSTNSLALILNATALPTATITAGSLTIE